MRCLPALALTMAIAACDPATTSPPTTTDDCDAGVVDWDTPVIDTDVTFACTTRYDGDMTITGHLVLAPCSRLELGGGSRIFVLDGGILEAVGTADCPVTITSSSSAPAAGDWQFVDIESTADGSTRFEHAVLEYGGGSGSAAMVLGGGLFDIVDTTVADSAAMGIDLKGGRVPALSRVRFENIETHPVRIDIEDAAVIEDLVVVEAGEPRILLQPSSALEVDTTLAPQSVPYELSGSMAFRADLLIEAGTHLTVAPGSRMFVEGGARFDLMGTEADPILMESAAERPFPGDWQQVTFKSDADASVWSHATIRHGGGGSSGAARVEGDNRLTLDNVTFEDNDVCDVDRVFADPVEVPVTNTPYVDCP